jgi:uncharacterized radical SAM superfamily Fe-S cluster-containing enzyme
LSTQTAMPQELLVLQPETTYTGSRINALHQGLPKMTQSLCPECGELLQARIFEADGKAKMEKTCPKHGYFTDTISSDVGLYLKMERFHFGDNRGLSNPAIPKATRCPEQCGLCSMHASHTGLANVDLTNRCNLTCPVCFANANVAGYLYEPSFEQVRRMLQALRDERPVAGRVVQFSGGEPTLHPRFHDICAMARDMGFSHIQAATNGILFADLEFAQKARESGLHQLYLQFDGVCDDIYRRTRGASLLEPKLKAIENCRKVGLKIVFVPTIVKGVNDHQIGDLVRLAIENIDCTSGLTFQPVAFTGRINRHDLAAKRFTLADVAHAVSEQTGITDAYHDWFPLSCVTPFSRLISALRGEETVTLTCHPHCSLGTYLFVDEMTKQAVPVTRFMDIPALLRDIELLARSAERSRIKFFSKINAWSKLKKHFKAEFAPPGLTFNRWVQTIQGCVDKKYGRNGMDGTYSYRTLMVAGMHFMDAYNYDVERVKRCVIHYAAPNGLIYPFCAYNSGPVFREKIEKKYSVPFARSNGNGNGNGAAVPSCGTCGTE